MSVPPRIHPLPSNQPSSPSPVPPFLPLRRGPEISLRPLSRPGQLHRRIDPRSTHSIPSPRLPDLPITCETSLYKLRRRSRRLRALGDFPPLSAAKLQFSRPHYAESRVQVVLAAAAPECRDRTQRFLPYRHRRRPHGEHIPPRAPPASHSRGPPLALSTTAAEAEPADDVVRVTALLPFPPFQPACEPRRSLRAGK